MDNYSWRLPGLAKAVDPGIAAKELMRLQSIYQAITPEILVTESMPKDAPLHNIFEWNDQKAAHAHRLQQARTLINNIQITVIGDGKPRFVSVYDVVSKDGGYKSLNTMNPNEVQFVIKSTKMQLEFIREKLKMFKDLENVLCHIENAINALP